MQPCNIVPSYSSSNRLHSLHPLSLLGHTNVITRIILIYYYFIRLISNSHTIMSINFQQKNGIPQYQEQLHFLLSLIDYQDLKMVQILEWVELTENLQKFDVVLITINEILFWRSECTVMTVLIKFDRGHFCTYKHFIIIVGKRL